MYHRLMRFVEAILILGLAGSALAHGRTSFKAMYVFGDSYSDIGEGYLDGNGPTAVAYLAKELGFTLVASNKSQTAKQSLDFAVSGAQTGMSEGRRIGSALLGFGMGNQVEEFARRLADGKIRFQAERTLFFIAGGLNDRSLPTEITIKNIKGEMTELYTLGARHFEVALLPTMIPAFSQVGLRLNPALALLPEQLKQDLPAADISLSHWGLFFDEVMKKPAEYGLQNTTNACAGRELFKEDARPCATPDAYFYYHANHPSTAVHKAVGAMMADEIRASGRQQR